MDIPKIKIRNSFEVIKNVRSIKKIEGKYDDKNIQLSYVIPTYNRLKTLKEAINSIINARHIIDYEIVICDNSGDVSDDNPIYHYLMSLNNDRITFYVHEKNIGMAGNWNRCIELANAPYVAMLHDDDLLAANYESEILQCINVANKQDKQFAYIRPNRRYFQDGEEISAINDNRNGSILPIRVIDCLLVGKGGLLAPTCGTLFYKKAVIDVGGFDQRYYPSLDHLLGYEFLKNGYATYKTRAVLGWYRWGINESLNKGIQDGFYIMDAAIREYMYSTCKYSKVFIDGLRIVQYKQSLKNYIKLFKHQGLTLNYQELDYLRMGSEYPCYYFLYHCLKMIVKHTNKFLD